MATVVACGVCGEPMFAGLQHNCRAKFTLGYGPVTASGTGCRPVVFVTAEEVRSIIRDELAVLMSEWVLTCAPKEQKP